MGTVHEDRYMYIYGNSSLNSTLNEKYFRESFRKSKHSYVGNFFPQESCRL
jgi:hypothetical protein